MPTELDADPDQDLLDRWNATLPDQQEIGERLLQRYREPHRRYHGIAHLRRVLEQIDALDEGQDLFLVRLAAWFHDAVYAIPERELTNVEASARLAVRELGRAGLEQEDMAQISRLVRVTADHIPGTRDQEGELICDADLSILGVEPAAYADYVRAVREEYAAVPDQRFMRARLSVLIELRRRPLFRTGKGQALVARAEANVDAEIIELADTLGVDLKGSRP